MKTALQRNLDLANKPNLAPGQISRAFSLTASASRWGIGICLVAMVGCSNPFWGSGTQSDPLTEAVANRSITPKKEEGFLSKLNPFRKDPNTYEHGSTSFEMPEASELTPQQQLEQDLSLARVMESKDEVTRARNIYLDLEKGYPEEPRIQHRLGILAAGKKKGWPEAEQRMKRALELGERNCDILSDLGYLYYLQNKYDEANQLFDESLEIDGQHERTLINKGLVLGETGKFDEALALFETSLDRAPAYHNLGYVYSQLGDLERAEHYVNKALTHDRHSKVSADLLLDIDASRKLLAEKKRLFEEKKIDGQLVPEDSIAQQGDRQQDLLSRGPLGAPATSNYATQNFAQRSPNSVAGPGNTASQATSSQPTSSVSQPPPLAEVAAGTAVAASPASDPGSPAMPPEVQGPAAPTQNVTTDNSEGLPAFLLADPTRSTNEATKTTPVPPESQVVSDASTPATTEANSLPSPDSTIVATDTKAAPKSEGISWQQPRIPARDSAASAAKTVATTEPVYREPATTSAGNEPNATAKTSASDLVDISDKPAGETSSNPMADLATVEDFPRGTGSSYRPRQAGSDAGSISQMISQQTAQPPSRSATSSDAAIPVYYGPKQNVEKVEERSVARINDRYAELKRRAEQSAAEQSAATQQNLASSTAMTSQAVAKPATNGQAVQPAGQIPATTPASAGGVQPASASDELPPVLTPAEYYNRRLGYDASAAAAQAQTITPAGMQPATIAPPTQQTFQPSRPTQPTGQQEAADGGSPITSDRTLTPPKPTNRAAGLLQGLKFPWSR